MQLCHITGLTSWYALQLIEVFSLTYFAWYEVKLKNCKIGADSMNVSQLYMENLYNIYHTHISVWNPLGIYFWYKLHLQRTQAKILLRWLHYSNSPVCLLSAFFMISMILNSSAFNLSTKEKAVKVKADLDLERSWRLELHAFRTAFSSQCAWSMLARECKYTVSEF